ncbi:methyltransferase domain-containing protein [Tuwongella immobilis]|nr:methyltransferase domain-containing protein [Tuwongella immobilis]
MGAMLAAMILLTSPSLGQDKSVKPGINDSFRNPNIQEWVTKFEGESREVFAQRLKVVSACEIPSGSIIADVGAGTGLYTRLFAEAVGAKGTVFAVDIAPKFLEQIATSAKTLKLDHIRTVLGTDTTTQLAANSVDTVFVCDTYHHFEFPQRMLASIHAALKPGGRLIVIDFKRIPGTSADWVLGHVRAGQDVVEREITDAGFRKVNDIKELLKENYFVIFQKPAAIPPTTTPMPATPMPIIPPEKQAYPIIRKVGGVVMLPGAVEPPVKGAKMVIDITADGPADEVHKGLKRAALVLNLYGAAGLKASDVTISVVFHGKATRCVLTDAAYATRTNQKTNPNLPVIRDLQAVGVEILVCGQALNYSGIEAADVTSTVKTAHAAVLVIVNRQQQGFAYVPVH